MNRRLASFIIFSALTVLPLSASAHTLKVDGSIGAILHIDPNDDPSVGQPSTFFFEFKDKQGRFKPADCNCTFTISQADHAIFTQPLFESSQTATLASALVKYTFTDRGVYKISVTGTPKTGASFQPFRLDYDQRVATIASPATAEHGSSDLWLYVAFATFTTVFTSLLLIKRRRKNR